jgi:hypothetical protein
MRSRCDPRGAAVFAPPPQIQDPELSLDIPPDCAEDSPLDVRNVVPGHTPLQFDTSTPDLTLFSTTGFFALVFSERLPFLLPEAERPPSAPTSSLERPPRLARAA